MKRLAALALVTLFNVGAVLGPASGGDKGDKNETGTLDSPYYPLKIGTTWDYVANSKKVTVKVTKHEDINGVKCARLETDTGGGAVMSEDLTVKEDGVYRVRAQGKDVKPPFLMLKLPPKKDDSWTVDSMAENFAIKGKLSVAADSEKVTVGKETYDAVLVKSSDLKMGGQAAVMECWYAKDRGMVKQHFRIPGASLDVTVELEKFTAGK